MKNVNLFARVMIAMAAIGLCLPSAALSATTVASPSVEDVALLDGNVLVGQLVDANGGNVGEVPVLLQQQNQTIVALKTNKDGVFAAKGVPAGVYRLATDNTQGIYRLWAPKTAPPSAQKGALLVSGDQVVRGQYGSPLRNMLANPWIVAGIVACAVAIPVAIHNSHHDSSQS